MNLLCPWPLDATCLPPDWELGALTPEQRTAVDIASDLLARATAWQYGPCPVTIRPCRPEQAMACTGPCGCAPVCRVWLPGPATAVLEVRVADQVMPADAYRIADEQWLIVQEGTPCFPNCQRYDRPLGEPGTWAVTYLRGKPVPDAGRRAVTALAVRIAKDCGAGGTCTLDPRTVRVTRQGTSYDLTTDSPMGRVWLGLPMVSEWVASVNPNGLQAPLSFWTPEMGYREITTAPAVRQVMGLTATAVGMEVTATTTGETPGVWFAWGDGSTTYAD